LTEALLEAADVPGTFGEEITPKFPGTERNAAPAAKESATAAKT
jgi:hypothetical protein